MKPTITNLLFSCTIFFAGNSYAQNTKVELVDKAVMERTGMDISACPGIDKTDITDHSMKRTIKKNNYFYEINKGNYHYAYNPANKVFSMSMRANANATNDADKLEYKKVADTYAQLKASLGKPDKTFSRRGITIENWKGTNGTILLGNNERKGLVSVLYANKDLAAK